MMWPFKQWRRAKLRGSSLTPGQWELVDRNVPVVRCLAEPERQRLGGHIRVFLAEKRFEGAGGLEVTDEIRLTVAAQACLLILNHDDPTYYPRLRSVIIYPRKYFARHANQGPGGIVHEGVQARLGESWDSGYVVLSWDDVQRGVCCSTDGQNVVYHEFAHQLDSESGATDGAPVLADRMQYASWARVLGSEYAHLRRAAAFNEPTLLRKYGATSPPEFFAVATESFFEQPAALKRTHPELYAQLAEFYRQDPAGRAECMERCEAAPASA